MGPPIVSYFYFKYLLQIVWITTPHQAFKHDMLLFHRVQPWNHTRFSMIERHSLYTLKKMANHYEFITCSGACQEALRSEIVQVLVSLQVEKSHCLFSISHEWSSILSNYIYDFLLFRQWSSHKTFSAQILKIKILNIASKKTVWTWIINTSIKFYLYSALQQPNSAQGAFQSKT